MTGERTETASRCKNFADQMNGSMGGKRTKTFLRGGNTWCRLSTGEREADGIGQCLAVELRLLHRHRSTEHIVPCRQRPSIMPVFHLDFGSAAVALTPVLAHTFCRSPQRQSERRLTALAVLRTRADLAAAWPLSRPQHLELLLQQQLLLLLQLLQQQRQDGIVIPLALPPVRSFGAAPSLPSLPTHSTRARAQVYSRVALFALQSSGCAYHPIIPTTTHDPSCPWPAIIPCSGPSRFHHRRPQMQVSISIQIALRLLLQEFLTCKVIGRNKQ